MKNLFFLCFAVLGIAFTTLVSCEKEVECPPIPEPEVFGVDTLTNVQLASTELVNHEYDLTANIVTFTMKAVIENNIRIVENADIVEGVETQEVEFDLIYDLSSSGLNAHLIEAGEQLVVKNYLQTTFDENGVAYSKFNGSEFQVVHTFKKQKIEEIEAFGKKFSDFVTIYPSFYLKDFVLKETGYAFNFEFVFKHEDKTTEKVITEAGGDYDPVETTSINMIDSTLVSAVYANDAISLNMQAVIQKVVTIATLSGADTISKESEVVDFAISYPLTVAKSETFAVYGEADLAEANYVQTEFANGVATSSWGTNNKITHTLGQASAHKVEAFGKVFENFVEPMVPALLMSGAVVDASGYAISFGYDFGNNVIATASITGEIDKIIETVSVDMTGVDMVGATYAEGFITFDMRAYVEKTTTITQTGKEDVINKEQETVSFSYGCELTISGVDELKVFSTAEVSKETYGQLSFSNRVAYSSFNSNGGNNIITHTLGMPSDYKIESFGKTFENFVSLFEPKLSLADVVFNGNEFTVSFAYTFFNDYTVTADVKGSIPETTQTVSVDLVDTKFSSVSFAPAANLLIGMMVSNVAKTTTISQAGKEDVIRTEEAQKSFVVYYDFHVTIDENFNFKNAEELRSAQFTQTEFDENLVCYTSWGDNKITHDFGVASDPYSITVFDKTFENFLNIRPEIVTADYVIDGNSYQIRITYRFWSGENYKDNTYTIYKYFTN